jgi:hypothetical protein
MGSIVIEDVQLPAARPFVRELSRWGRLAASQGVRLDCGPHLRFRVTTAVPRPRLGLPGARKAPETAAHEKYGGYSLWSPRCGHAPL